VLLFGARGRFRKRNLLIALSPLASLHAETLTFQLQPNEIVKHEIVSEVDDSHLRDPCGYSQPGNQSAWFIGKISIQNTGAEPLLNTELVINDKEWGTFSELARSLSLGDQPGAVARRFYTYWKDHRTHATNGTKLNRHPLGVLNFWGYTFCGDDTAAVSMFLHHVGISSRRVPLNGHVAGEYFFDGKWNVIDGDQTAVYLNLDNRSFASYEEICSDPFLALRTKIFGKYAPMNPKASGFNTSLFELVAPPESRKPRKIKPSEWREPVQDLWPQERLIIYCDQSPPTASGPFDITQWKEALKAQCVVELIGDARRARAGDSALEIVTGFPLLEARNHNTGWRESYANREPHFTCSIPIAGGSDQFTVRGHRARVSLPLLLRGHNTIQLKSTNTSGNAVVTIDYSPLPGIELPVVTVASQTNVFVDEQPSFRVTATADTLWWQIASDPGFDFVAPNFDAIAPFTGNVTVDLLTDTFFEHDRDYYIRAKGKRANVWGEWSKPLQFRVQKPVAPQQVICGRDSQHVYLHWTAPQSDARYLIFGSNRMDFVPEIYTGIEATALENGEVTASRPNKNLLATVASPRATVPPFRFYRIIAQRGKAYSVPSPLIRLPSEFAHGLPPAIVLQTRWSKLEGPQYPNGYIDRYIASEIPLN
jgi:hypothetical protein